jgi:hypothetical protein
MHTNSVAKLVAGVDIVTCMKWLYTVTPFIEHVFTQLVSTSNYNSLAGLHNLKITVTAAHKIFHVFTSRFLVTDPNNFLC